MDGVIKAGDRLPPFAPKSVFGQEVRSFELWELRYVAGGSVPPPRCGRRVRLPQRRSL
jgi:hypothetical protein